MSTSSAPAAQNPQPLFQDERLGILGADRPCAGCGFNLHGATIFREQHYRLVAVRCPECGTVAALQEYPAISRWAARLSGLGAIAYLLVALGSLIIVGTIMWGMCEMVADDVTAPYQNRIDAAASEHVAKKNPANPVGVYMPPIVVQDWWEALPPSKFLADHGGVRGALNWWGLADWGYVFPLFLMFGVLWSVLFSHVRRAKLMLLMLLPTIIGLAFYYSAFRRYASSAGPFYYGSGTRFAALQVGWIPALMTFGFCLATLVAAAIVGRSLGRWFLQTTLPPRLLPAFSFLWTTDNKPLPRPATRPHK